MTKQTFSIKSLIKFLENKKINFIAIVAFASLALAGILLMIPAVQNVGIKVGEVIARRELRDYDKWLRMMTRSGRMLLIADVAVTILYFLNKKFSIVEKIKKQIKYIKENLTPYGLMYISAIKNEENKKLFKTAITASCIIFFVTHAYCFLNVLYSHDSLMVFQDDAGWQISLGRFVQPFYVFIRGKIVSPLWIGTLSFLFLVTSIYLIVKMLKIKNMVQICLSAGILITSSTYVLSNATYLPWSDIYTLDLLCAVVAAYVAIYYKRFYALSVICMVTSLGLYQSYVQVTVLLLVFDISLDVLSNKDFKHTLQKAIKYLSMIIISLLLYFCIFKLFLVVFKIQPISSYNGLTEVGKYDNFNQIIKLFGGSYLFVFRKFFNPITYNEKIAIMVKMLLCWFAGICVCAIARKNKISKINTALLFALILIFPFAFNFVYFISKGMEHDLMTYSFYIVPILLFVLMNYASIKYKSKFTIAVYFCFGILIFNSIIFANQTYLNKDLTHRATLSVFTRIIDRLEQTDGYIPGETPVCFIGDLNSNTIVSKHRHGFIVKGTGTTISAVTYNTQVYLENILAYPVKFYNEVPSEEIVNELDIFPSKNSCKVIDGVCYVKIGKVY